MPKQWIAVSADTHFTRKLALLGARLGVDVRVASDEIPDGAYDGYLIDTDTYKGRLPDGRVYLFSRTREDHLPIPTPIETVESVLRTEAEVLSLGEDRRASLGPRSVLLTEVESALLRVLLDAEGECVSADRLIEQVWNGNATPSCVNVYIHYLRQKLEIGGERIVRSRRGEGYYIDEKYRREREGC